MRYVKGMHGGGHGGRHGAGMVQHLLCAAPPVQGAPGGGALNKPGPPWPGHGGFGKLDCSADLSAFMCCCMAAFALVRLACEACVEEWALCELSRRLHGEVLRLAGGKDQAGR